MCCVCSLLCEHCFSPDQLHSAAETDEKHAKLLEEAAAYGIVGVAALNEATDANLAALRTRQAVRSAPARYVQALLVLDACDSSTVPRSVADVVLGVTTGNAAVEAVTEARRVIASLSLELGVSALRPWTAGMPEFDAGLRALLEYEVEDARKRVEDRVSRLVTLRNSMRGGKASTAAADKARECVGAARAMPRARLNLLTLTFSASNRRRWAKDAATELASLETVMATLAEVTHAAATAFSKEERNKIFAGTPPWGACASGVHASKGDLLERFHRVRSMLARIGEEHELLPIEAQRGVMYFDKCCAALEVAISELEAPAEPPAEPSAEWARAAAERVGKAYLLRKHLSTYQGLGKRARTLWSVWASSIQPPSGSTDVNGSGAAAGASHADGQDSGDDSEFDD